MDLSPVRRKSSEKEIFKKRLTWDGDLEVQKLNKDELASIAMTGELAPIAEEESTKESVSISICPYTKLNYESIKNLEKIENHEYADFKKVRRIAEEQIHASQSGLKKLPTVFDVESVTVSCMGELRAGGKAGKVMATSDTAYGRTLADLYQNRVVRQPRQSELDDYDKPIGTLYKSLSEITCNPGVVPKTREKLENESKFFFTVGVVFMNSATLHSHNSLQYIKWQLTDLGKSDELVELYIQNRALLNWKSVKSKGYLIQVFQPRLSLIGASKRIQMTVDRVNQIRLVGKCTDLAVCSEVGCEIPIKVGGFNLCSVHKTDRLIRNSRRNVIHKPIGQLKNIETILSEIKKENIVSSMTVPHLPNQQIVTVQQDKLSLRDRLEQHRNKKKEIQKNCQTDDNQDIISKEDLEVTDKMKLQNDKVDLGITNDNYITLSQSISGNFAPLEFTKDPRDKNNVLLNQPLIGSNINLKEDVKDNAELNGIEFNQQNTNVIAVKNVISEIHPALVDLPKQSKQTYNFENKKALVNAALKLSSKPQPVFEAVTESTRQKELEFLAKRRSQNNSAENMDMYKRATLEHLQTGKKVPISCDLVRFDHDDILKQYENYLFTSQNKQRNIKLSENDIELTQKDTKDSSFNVNDIKSEQFHDSKIDRTTNSSDPNIETYEGDFDAIKTQVRVTNQVKKRKNTLGSSDIENLIQPISYTIKTTPNLLTGLSDVKGHTNIRSNFTINKTSNKKINSVSTKLKEQSQVISSLQIKTQPNKKLTMEELEKMYMDSDVL